MHHSTNSKIQEEALLAKEKQSRKPSKNQNHHYRRTLLLRHSSRMAPTTKVRGEVIGIDLGTTFSCVALARNGRAEIIVNDQGNRTTPSAVAFSAADSHRLVGDSAKNQAALNPRRTIFDVKRLIGKKFYDAEVQRDLMYLPYPVVNRGGKPYVEIEVKAEGAKNQVALNPPRNIIDVKRRIGKNPQEAAVQRDSMRYSPYPVVSRGAMPCAEVLEVKAEGREMKKAFSPEEISAMILGKMKEIAESYLGEPLGGAVITVPAYFNDLQRQATKDAGRIAGLNVIRIINEPTAAAIAYGLNNLDLKRKQTKSKILVYDLGGGTFDVSVLEVDGKVFRVLATGGDTHLGGGDFDRRVIEYFVKLIKRKYNKEDISEDKRALGKLRRECERAKRTLSSQSEVRVEIDSLFPGMDFSEPLSRAKFEELNLDLFKKTLDVVKTTLKDAKLEKSEIEDIVLVGGSTRIPRVREMLKEMFNGKEPSRGVNPDEAVAYGAAILGANLRGEPAIYGITLFDVTPLSLGTEVHGGLMSVVIPKNTAIPTKMSAPYETVQDYQTSADITVYQGERPLARDCVKLGRFVLSGITPAPRGVVKFEDTFEINEDGILKVTSKEKNSSASQSLTITSYNGNLGEAEIQRMIKDAQKMAEEDKMAKAGVEAWIRLERFVYDVKKTINDGDNVVGSKMGLVDRKRMEAALGKSSRWLEDNQHASLEDCEKKLKEVTDVWNPIIKRVYGM